ncbi:MAG: response regulator [Bacteroidia bacterium]|nr:response regulator [Bacteroidia bacterium]
MLKNVMLVDDDDVTLMICKLRLKKSGFTEEVLSFENGEDAIKYFENQMLLPENERVAPELIFLDINMPVMNGWEFLDAFEEKYIQSFPHTKIKILSSSVDPKDEEKAHSNKRILGFVTKPLTNDNLLEIMQTDAFKNHFQNS